MATACGVLREILSPLSWDGDAAARLLMGLIAFLGAGLFVSELARNHKLAVEHAGQLKRQIDLREEVQEDLRVLVESSPAAIFTLDAGGRILLANEAAQRLLGFEEHPTDESIAPFLPALLSALERPPLLLRTNMECIGRRRTGGLTERERTVLRGVFDGLANKEIAARLGISESAVKGLLQQMFHKTGVRTRSQLVRVALERYSQDL